MLSTQPVVLRGIANDWPLVKAARAGNAAFLSQLDTYYSGEPIVVYEGNDAADNRVFYNEDMSGFNFTPVQIDFPSFCKRLEKQKKLLYMGSTMVDRWFPHFRQENIMNLEGIDPLVSLWLGNQSRIAAHCDFPQNLAIVVAGKRRFTLFPPDQQKNLYIGPLDFTPAGQAISLVDFHSPDLTRFPRFPEALKHAYVAELEPGDGIVIPSMWWHHVEGLSQINGLVNYWWRTSPAYLGNPTLALKHAILSIAQLPEEQKQAWRHQFSQYVFNDREQTCSHIPDSKRGITGQIDELKARQLRAELLNKLNR
nr:cupin-like domain-containing protein [Alteromonas sp. ASW11-130]